MEGDNAVGEGRENALVDLLERLFVVVYDGTGTVAPGADKPLGDLAVLEPNPGAALRLLKGEEGTQRLTGGVRSQGDRRGKTPPG